MKNIFALFHVNAVRKENEALREKNDSLHKDNEVLRKKYDGFRQEIEALEEKSDGFRQENKALRKNCDTVLCQENQALREENNALRKSINTIENGFLIDNKSLLTKKAISSSYRSSGNSDQAMLCSP